jgi:Fur family ferric uptake transcriptional regulator
MRDLENKFVSYLKVKGLRCTPERREILHGIFSIKSHFDADTLYDYLKKKKSSLSKATIYRSLPLFLQSGLLKESPRSRGRSQYELIYGHEHHDHLICLSCNRIIEFKHDGIEKLQNQVCRGYDFTPVDHNLSIRGYCRECVKKMDER